MLFWSLVKRGLNLHIMEASICLLLAAVLINVSEMNCDSKLKQKLHYSFSCTSGSIHWQIRRIMLDLGRPICISLASLPVAVLWPASSCRTGTTGMSVYTVIMATVQYVVYSTDEQVFCLIGEHYTVLNACSFLCPLEPSICNHMRLCKQS